MIPSTSKRLMAHHPLQRLVSPSRNFSLLIHLLGTISFTLSYRYLFGWQSFITEAWGWHYMFLTIIGLTLAYLTFICGLLADITLSPQLFLIKNSLSLCSAPLEVLISLLYYGIKAIDEKLVIPPGMSIEPLADLGFHLAPAFFLTVDLLLLSPPWTIHALPAMGLSSVLATAYWLWVNECYKHNRFYPYPLFEQLDTSHRAVLFGTAAIMMTGSTLMLKFLYGKVNGLQGAERRSKPSNMKAK